jgi:hypothetical protein
MQFIKSNGEVVEINYINSTMKMACEAENKGDYPKAHMHMRNALEAEELLNSWTWLKFSG